MLTFDKGFGKKENIWMIVSNRKSCGLIEAKHHAELGKNAFIFI